MDWEIKAFVYGTLDRDRRIFKKSWRYFWAKKFGLFLGLKKESVSEKNFKTSAVALRVFVAVIAKFHSSFFHRDR